MRSCASSRRSRPRSSPTWTTCGRCSTRSAAPASASCSRARRGRAARRGPRHRSLRHVLQHGGGAGGDRLRDGAGAIGLRAGARQGAAGVGSGPFPTELTDEVASGSASAAEPRCQGGTQRRLPGVAAIKVSGVDGIALTKLDVLDGFPEIKVSVGYVDGSASTACPPAPMRRRASSRSTRPSRAGRSRRAGRAAGVSCRRRR